MRFHLLLLLTIVLGCRSERSSQTEYTQTKHTDSQSVVVQARDTVGSGAAADALLDSLGRRSPDSEGSPFDIATTTGDTLGVKGGEGLGNDTLHPYVMELYSWNGLSFVRIKRAADFRADGYPRWSTLARTVIPPVDSGQSVLLNCRVDKKDDPFVFGTALIAISRSSIAHAWRFDTTSVKLQEIVAANVKCSHLLGSGD